MSSWVVGIVLSSLVEGVHDLTNSCCTRRRARGGRAQVNDTAGCSISTDSTNTVSVENARNTDTPVLEPRTATEETTETEAGACMGTARATRKRAETKNAFKRPSSKPLPAVVDGGRGGSDTPVVPIQLHRNHEQQQKKPQKQKQELVWTQLARHAKGRKPKMHSNGHHVSRDAGARRQTPSTVQQTQRGQGQRTRPSTWTWHCRTDSATISRRAGHMHKSTQSHIDMLTRESTETLIGEAPPHDMQSHLHVFEIVDKQ